MTSAVPDNDKPLVTVAVPTYERPLFLRECVRSICAQTYARLEILIADNASSDSTPTALEELAALDSRVRIVRHELNLGMVGNFNWLLRAARGEFFLLVSDDDILLPNAIDQLVSAFTSASIVLAYGPAMVIDERGGVRDLYALCGPPIESGRDFIQHHLRGERSVTLACTMFSIGSIEDRERELFDPVVGPVCDLLHRLRRATRGNVACVPTLLAKYRVHEANLTASNASFVASLFRVLESPSVSVGELRPYKAQIREFVVRTSRIIARSAAARGRLPTALDTLQVLESHGVDVALLRIQARVLSLAPVRALTRARRNRRAKWAEHHARSHYLGPRLR